MLEATVVSQTDAILRPGEAGTRLRQLANQLAGVAMRVLLPS